MAASPAPTPRPADIDELELEARWRLREWDAPIWWTVRGDGVALCQAEACDADLAPIYRDRASLEAAIDRAAERYWRAFCASVPGMVCKGAMVVSPAAYPDTFFGGPRNGLPEILAYVGDREKIRDIDMLFWALSEMAALHYVDATPGQVPFEVHAYDDLVAELDWLAARYGLKRSGELIDSWPHDATEEMPVNRGDLFYGIFTRPSGERYACSRDAPPGKYCCGLICSQIGGPDSLQEGH